MICDKCKKFFLPGNRPDGIPNGLGFVLQNGKKITVCADCVMKLGAMQTDAERDKFFEELNKVEVQ